MEEGGLLLYLLACLKEDLLLDLDADTVKQLDGVLSAELPKAKGWKRLRAQVAALTQHPDVREYVGKGRGVGVVGVGCGLPF